MTKLRFLGTAVARDTYLMTTHNDEFTYAMKIRLNMMDMVTKNYGGKEMCYLCGEEDSKLNISCRVMKLRILFPWMNCWKQIWVVLRNGFIEWKPKEENSFP